jgi:NAD-dependent DNA ligase
VSIFDDGEVSSGERNELYEMFCDTVGDGGAEATWAKWPSTLPLDDPAPTVLFEDHAFCFTGIFVYGSRDRCIRAIEERAGRAVDHVSCDDLYLVVGTRASDAWIQSGWGRKIEAAVEFRSRGCLVKIVSERQWADALSADEP